jgi:undecaprenyl-diphosphatase
MALARRIPVIWLALAALALLAAGFALLADEVVEGSLRGLDLAILQALRNPLDMTDPVGPAWVDEAARDLTALGSNLVLGIFAALTGLYFIIIRRVRLGVILIASAAGGMALSSLLKSVFDLPRPQGTAAVRVFTPSFPSGHATASAAVYLTIGGLMALRASSSAERAFVVAAAILLVLMIGSSRVYLGVHYPSDVLAGWLIGAGWAIACVLAARR